MTSECIYLPRLLTFCDFNYVLLLRNYSSVSQRHNGLPNRVILHDQCLHDWWRLTCWNSCRIGLFGHLADSAT